MEKIEVTGKTVEEALINAALQLETSSDNLEYEVIEKGSNGLFGFINSKPAKILVSKKQEENASSPLILIIPIPEPIPVAIAAIVSLIFLTSDYFLPLYNNKKGCISHPFFYQILLFFHKYNYMSEWLFALALCRYVFIILKS